MPGDFDSIDLRDHPEEQLRVVDDVVSPFAPDGAERVLDEHRSAVTKLDTPDGVEHAAARESRS